MGRQFKHLSETDRLKIEKALREGKPPKQIAKEIRVHISTVYREIKRGQYEHLTAIGRRKPGIVATLQKCAIKQICGQRARG